MFHLYFGTFDLILYAVAFIVAMSLSRAICDDIDAVALQPAPVVAAHQTDTAIPIPTDKKMGQQPTTTSLDTETVQKPTTSRLEDTDGKTSRKPVLKLSEIRLYKLRKKSVVRLSDLPFSVPKTVQRYKLRKKSVVKLEDLKSIMEVIS